MFFWSLKLDSLTKKIVTLDMSVFTTFLQGEIAFVAVFRRLLYAGAFFLISI